MSNSGLSECGRRLRAGREGLGLSQAALAMKVGVDQSALHRWEAGEREPNLAKRHLLACVLGSDPYAIEQPAEAAS
ncbi:MAG TPA: helix-turn-helix transcriptional regulator [Acidimicrobiales bacterium]|nr:helix-turn-helix transcriptional regulator [Acidimicrobiales bacterium]